MSNTNFTPFEVVRQSFRALSTEYPAFLHFWDMLCDSDSALTIGRAIVENRFNTQMLVNGDAGYRSEPLQAMLVYGDWNPNGNLGGSLYVLFGHDTAITPLPYRNILRMRWAGDNALYLNGPDNYVRVERRHFANGDIQTTLQHGRVGGRVILAVEEAGVRTLHPQARAKLRYEGMKERGESMKGIEDPGEAEDIIVRHEELTAVLEGMREGIRIAHGVMDELVQKQHQRA